MKFESLAPAHAPEVFRLWSDFETVKFTNWTHTATPEGCAERVGKVIAFYAKEPLHFGPFVIRGDDGGFLGMIGADLVDADSRTYEVWYIVPRDRWGRGIATGALEKLIAFVLESGRVRSLVADVVAGNPPSSRVLEKMGFVREAMIPAGFQRHGLTHDLWKYSRAGAGPVPIS